MSRATIHSAYMTVAVASRETVAALRVRFRCEFYSWGERLDSADESCKRYTGGMLLWFMAPGLQLASKLAPTHGALTAIAPPLA